MCLSAYVFSLRAISLWVGVQTIGHLRRIEAKSKSRALVAHQPLLTIRPRLMEGSRSRGLLQCVYEVSMCVLQMR